MATPKSRSINPPQAQGAQIALENFTIPHFPPQAQGLMALTLTSAIKLEDYPQLLKQPFSVPSSLPKSIQSLTLELFSRGYPPGFLTALIGALPHIKTLVLYSQLFAGTTKESEADAIRFFQRATDLRALHLLDCYSGASFFEGIAPILREKEKGLMFLEVSFTARHSQRRFLDAVPADALTGLVSPRLVSLSMNMSAAEAAGATDNPTDHEAFEGMQEEWDGIQAFEGSPSDRFISTLTESNTAPRSLRGLNGTLYAISLREAKKILDKHRGLVVVCLTISADGSEKFKEQLREMLGGCKELEQVEIVLRPSTGVLERVSNDAASVFDSLYFSEKDMDSLYGKCNKLTSFSMSVVRRSKVARLQWEKGTGKWKGGVVGGSSSSNGQKLTEMRTSNGKEFNPWI